MDTESILRRYGLFDAKVPRYTSYPPANRFVAEVGRARQPGWISALDPRDPVSVYVHIPFCRRLCWFCACRTQGTQTLKPVDAYLDDVITEIAKVRDTGPDGLSMARLHLGGGTPTLLSADQMERLLDAIEATFAKADGYEFSVEIDPTEASDDVLDCLARRGMERASIGVQDFEPKVQQAIGRLQSYEETKTVIDRLRSHGIQSLNIDLLYGLPYQTRESLLATLDQVITLNPDRLALYGYAHVPHMSKRQAVIPKDALPSTEERYREACAAERKLVANGYLELGIDHFALADDSLAKAAEAGQMRRNFQGYTDDPCTTLLGFGASAISTFADGFTQNAVSTGAYRQRVQATGLAAHKGHVLTADEKTVAEMINSIMCTGSLDLRVLNTVESVEVDRLVPLLANLEATFPDAVRRAGTTIELLPEFNALARVVAARLDLELLSEHIHSTAI